MEMPNLGAEVRLNDLCMSLHSSTLLTDLQHYRLYKQPKLTLIRWEFWGWWLQHWARCSHFFLLGLSAVSYPCWKVGKWYYNCHFYKILGISLRILLIPYYFTDIPKTSILSNFFFFYKKEENLSINEVYLSLHGEIKIEIIKVEKNLKLSLIWPLLLSVAQIDHVDKIGCTCIRYILSS